MASGSDFVKRLDSVDFPAAPAVVVQVSRLLAEEWITAEQLAEVMALDPGISARVLRLANSVYFRGHGVRSIEEAVLRVGVEGVRDVVFALSLLRAFKPLHFHYHQFWRHGLAVAQTVQVLQRRALNLPAAIPEAYAAGLLHDIGMLVLDRTLGAGYGAVLSRAREQARPLHEIERETFGTDHADVGGRLLEVWRMPTVLTQAVGGHHDPLSGDNAAGQLVYLADFVCNLHGVHHGTGFKPANAVREVWDELGISEGELPAIIAEIDAVLDKADAVLAAATA
ncbi:MAG: HDOD domain-containing protein [Opitutaceae bacterium]